MAKSLPTTDYPFRAATVIDVTAIAKLVQSAYRGDSSRTGWTTEADLLDGQRTDIAAITALLNSSANRLLLCECNSTLLASAHLERNGSVCHFGMFAVQPAMQNHGIGRALLAEAERIARDDWHCEEMHMLVITLRSELIAWYERRGYARLGVFKPFPYGDARFGLPKRDDLRLEVLSKPLANP